jgi:hypothetical protein
MKAFIRQPMFRSTLVLACLLGASASLANSVEPTEPSEYCFEQSELRGGLTQTTFKYNLIFAAGDRNKNVDVFTGLRLKSRPDALWLSNFRGVWSAYDANIDPIAYFQFPRLTSTVFPVDIIPQPIDLSAFSGNGELLVGYGVRNGATTTTRDSFQDMINNQRYSVVWGHKPSSARIYEHLPDHNKVEYSGD